MDTRFCRSPIAGSPHGRPSGTRLRGLLSLAFLMLCPPIAGAIPISYSLTYSIASVYGDGVPAAWGSIAAGDSLSVALTWDTDSAVPAPGAPPGSYDPGVPTSYRISVGDAQVSTGSVLTSFAPFSTSLIALDLAPMTCTLLNPCGYWRVDSTFFRFECADWGAVASLPADLSCGSGLSGTLAFQLYPNLPPELAYFGLNASLSSVQQIPEPGTLGLLGLGMSLLFLFHRRRVAAASPDPDAFSSRPA